MLGALPEIVYTIVVWGLIVLFIISFTLFIRKKLLTNSTNNTNYENIEEKMDRIIELLEKDKD